MSKAADLSRFPSISKIVSSPPNVWSENDAPLAERGVRVSWLVGWLRSLLEDINRPRIEAIEQAQRAMDHNRAGMYGLHDQPDIPVPTVPRFALLNVRALVEHLVIPLTSALRAPLWAYVPPEQRGKPDFFVSHTWNSLLLGPPQQEIGTLDAIEHLHHFAWIDFVAYNQHTIESIPTDMEAVIGQIGKVIFAGTPVPTLGRIWCLWELLCANRTGTDFDIAIRPGYRNDKILAVNTLYRSFIGVEKAVATKPEDLKIIFDEVLTQFGSAEVANEHFDRVLRERFSGSWYELRERDQHLGFRPWPWLYEQMPGGQELSRRPVREPDPYYGAGIRDSLIYGSQQSTFDMLIEAGLKVSSDDKVEHEFRTSSETETALVEAARDGNLARVQELLDLGINPDRPISHGTALAHAAREGHAQIVELLLESGADIEGGDGLSPLACAAWNGKDEIIRLLIERGADIEGDVGGPGTALFQACARGRLSTVLLLLEFGASVDAKTEKRATPLLVAAADNHLDIVVQLIAAGADLNWTDRSGDTALHHAANGKPEAVPFYPHEFIQRQSAMGLTDPSALLMKGLSLDDLNPLERHRLREAVRKYGGDQSLLPLANEELDGALGLTMITEGRRCPTLAGLLLLGREEHLRRFVPAYETAFQVLEGTDVRVNEFYRKPLLQTFEEVEQLFRARVNEKEIQVGLFRVPVPNFDRRAFREAFVNALVHRDYSRLGAVHVRLDDDGLSISNPGGFVEGVTLQNLLVVAPRSRNPLLADIVKRIGLAEPTGRGIDRIYEGMLRYGRPAPDYGMSNAHTVSVQMLSAEADFNFLEMILYHEDRTGRAMPIDSLIMLSHLREKRRLATADLAVFVQKPETAVRANLEKLVEAGLVEAHGAGRGRTYTLSIKVYRHTGQKAAYVRQAGFDPIQQEQMVLSYIDKHGSIKRAEAADLCRIGLFQATRLLRKMTEAGLIQPRGQGKGTFYERA